ncbi:UDP-glycosyltransferase 73C4-like [Impatiens glandulifera]|uniref:UDP-glycosyltransferase 73C4-like n=1 Tax=Impatiens glandulifera TaxID=253017 RepID=UPI001FB111A5|nr:UDP-glycosyltransferase 73C4-like [Impatiens glandulifera]
MAFHPSTHNETGLHFILIPLPCPGHFIPAIDMAKLFASRGISTTVFLVPSIANRYGNTITKEANSNLPITFIHPYFPSVESGLPKNSDTVDVIPQNQMGNFMIALELWQTSIEHFIQQLKPFPPTCMITDRFLPIVAEIAKKLDIRRIIFDGTGCLNLLVYHQLNVSKIHETVNHDSEPFVVPGLPDRIELTRNQIPNLITDDLLKDYHNRVKEIDSYAYGLLINSFQELEQSYYDELRNLNSNLVWCVGPLSLRNSAKTDKSRRGNKSSIDENQCLKWLDKQNPSSVIYACHGSLNNLPLPHLVELGLGLEASNRPFIWVLNSEESAVEKWIKEEDFEKRTEGKGLIIRGWAPQLLILSHVAVGAFLTHCGWNSTLEGICSGVPMITWPLSWDQFINEKLTVEILGIGVGVGSKSALNIGEVVDEIEVSVKREDVTVAVEKIMDGDGEGEVRRRRVREIGEMAKKAVEEGGSSYHDMSLFIHDMMMIMAV